MVNSSHGPLCTRPPTPPKENIEDSVKLPVDHTYQGTLGQHILLDTPDDSPSSSSEYLNGSSGRLPKRVVFSPWTSYHKPLMSDKKTTVLDGQLRPLPPSKECVASQKSILRISTSSSPTSDLLRQLVLDPNETVAVMLRSVNQHLRSASRDSRLDSYRTLLGCLSAYEEVPDTRSLIENLAGFLEYIRRDILVKQTGFRLPDVELGSYALKVLTTILYTPGLRDAVPYEFGSFIAEQAVSNLENQDTPKVMLDHYMQLLARQKLPQKIITSEMANRILNALNGLEARVKGNRVVGLKLMIYQRLVVQVRSLMVPRAEEWLEFLISGMSSSIKDMRSRAIAFGMDAALALGTTAAVSQSCIDILNRETPSGAKVVDCLGARMLELLNVKDEGLHAPQIWITIILFLRSRRRQIERWEHLKGWFGIMQGAFNSSDAKVKLQANVAWNRFVSVINLDASTSAPILKVLRQAIASQLGRKSDDDHMRLAKQLSRSTYCNFLYYAFRPGATYEQLDFYWDGFVAPILPMRPSMTKSDLDFSYDVLGALLTSSQPRVWDEKRGQQVTPMKPEELPCLDPKWTRSRAAKIVSILEALRAHSTLAKSGDILATPFFRAWQSFVKALGDAASKEVKVSMETMTAVAHIITMLNRYWTQTHIASKAIPPRLDVFIAMIDETVAKIGFRPFTEKRLFHASSEGHFEAAETPSNRSARPHGNLKSPVTCVLETLIGVCHINEPAGTSPEAIRACLEIALRSASGRRTHLAILWELAQDVISGRSGDAEDSSRLVVWEGLAEETARALYLPQGKAQDSGNPHHPGNDYREAVQLLELGIREFGFKIYPSWKILSDAIVDKVQTEVGHAGILLVYAEPLSKAMHEEEPNIISDDYLHCGNYILDHVRWPESRQALDRVRKLLWGPGSTLRGSTPLDPFDHLYPMAETMLICTYSKFRSLSVDTVSRAVSGLNSFLLSCPASLRIVCLKRLQRGLGVWIEDRDAVLAPSHGSEELSTLKTSVKAMWHIVLDMIKSAAKPENSSLAIISDLLSAGFRSRHEANVNDLIMVWNEIFGKAEALKYPEALHRALTRIRSKVEIQLPGFVANEETEIITSPFSFVESQDEEIDAEPQKPSHMLNRSPSRDTAGVSRERRPEDTARSPMSRVGLQSPKSTPKGRLRHDDSQIKFAAVDSSPLMTATLESQHLTDRQIEVREQQEQGAAAMFPDIRSSPRRPRSAEQPPELILHRKQAFGPPLDADAEPSPTFPPGDTTMNEFLGSSPTPRSSRKSSVEPELSEDPAPSPPDSSPPISRPRVTTERKASSPLRDFVEQGKASNLVDGTLAGAPQLPGANIALLDYQTVQGPSAHGRTRSLEQRKSGMDIHAMSASEKHVDDLAHLLEEEKTDSIKHMEKVADMVMNVDHRANATTELPITPRTAVDDKEGAEELVHLGSGDFASVDDSFRQAPYTPSQDEQVREQLLRDLEEASSQGSRHISKRRPSSSSPSKVSKKRRANSSDGTKRSKTMELPASFRSFEVVVENRQSDESIDDCIIVDVRPAAGKGPSASPAIKQERSPSPVGKLLPSFARTPALKKVSGRRSTRSMTSRESLRSSVVDDPIAPTARPHPIGTDLRHREMAMMEQHPRKKRRTEQQQEEEDPAREGQTQVEDVEQYMGGYGEDDLPTRVPSADSQTVLAKEQDDMTSSQMEGIKEYLLRPQDDRLDVHVSAGQRPSTASNDGDTVPNTPQDDSQQGLGPGIAQQVARPPGQRILERFKHLLGDLGQVTLWPEEERQMVEVAVEVIKNAHEAGRKNGRQLQ